MTSFPLSSWRKRIFEKSFFTIIAQSQQKGDIDVGDELNGRI